MHSPIFIRQRFSEVSNGSSQLGNKFDTAAVTRIYFLAELMESPNTVSPVHARFPSSVFVVKPLDKRFLKAILGC